MQRTAPDVARQLLGRDPADRRRGGKYRSASHDQERGLGIPIADVNPTTRTPWVTRALVLINVAVAVVTPLSGCGAALAYLEWGLVPAGLFGADQVTVPGCGVGEVAGPTGLLTHMFLHAGIVHLVGNMIYLWVFGDNVEDRLGPARYLVLYIGGGLVAAAAQTATDLSATVPLVGASGAVAGVLGAYVVTYPRHRVATLLSFPASLLAFVVGSRWNIILLAVVELPAWLVLGGWVWIQLQGYATPGSAIAFAAHLGGFAAGVLLLGRLARGVPKPRDARR